jgi:hypothetical protein
MPSAVNTAAKEPVNWLSRSLIKNLTKAARWPRSIRKSRAACITQRRAVRLRGNACPVDATGVVLYDDQGVEVSQEHGVHVDEVGSEDAARFVRSGTPVVDAAAAPLRRTTTRNVEVPAR